MEPMGLEVAASPDMSLLEAAFVGSVELVSVCGGTGKCGKCKVRITRGKAPPPSPADLELLSSKEISEGFRLACQTRADRDLIVEVPPESLSTPQRVQLEAKIANLEPDSVVELHKVTLDPPSLFDLRADDRRILDALNKKGMVCETIDCKVQKELSRVLRAMKWKARLFVREREIIRIAGEGFRRLGLAVDLGTTKLAIYLVDLGTGRVIAKKGAMNPQIRYGEDVVTRINLAKKSPEKADKMQSLALKLVNSLAADMVHQVGSVPEDIVDTVIVGNTAMHHLALGLSVDQLVKAPHIPSISGAVDVKARELELEFSPGSYVHFLPNIAGFVGSDHLAMIQSTGIHKAGEQQTVLALDIGTNTEICLASHGRLTSLSCASGPAFEGAHIKYGMRAAEGAIERVRITGDKVMCQTIGRVRPAGICGSGLLDAVAQLYASGVIDKGGRISRCHPNVRSFGDHKEFLLIIGGNGSELAVTQKDIRQIQLAKAAIRSGIQVLLDEEGLTGDQIDRVLVAGAFGTYLGIESALQIGMLPDVAFNRIAQVGNAAGAGATQALISKAVRKESWEVAEKINYLELAGMTKFKEIFLKYTYLGDD